jgi:hypothetical protein
MRPKRRQFTPILLCLFFATALAPLRAQLAQSCVQEQEKPSKKKQQEKPTKEKKGRGVRQLARRTVARSRRDRDSRCDRWPRRSR